MNMLLNRVLSHSSSRALAAALSWLLGCVLSLAMGTVQAAPYDVQVLLDWAERTYPQLFPGPQPTLTSAPYVYRCYPNGNCAGVGEGIVYIYGPVAGGGLQAVAPMAQFECQVVPANCAAPRRSRVETDNFITIGRETSGRVIVWGNGLGSLRPLDGEPISGTSMRLLATAAEHAVVNLWGYMLLRSDGVVETWGHAANWVSSAANFASRKEITLPGRAVDVALNSGYFTAEVLLDDGSVWQLPGVSEVINGQSQRRPVRVDLPVPIRALHSGAPANAYYVARDGTVWRKARRGETTAIQVAGATEIDRIQCQNTVCVAQQASGDGWFWNINTAMSASRPLDVAARLPALGVLRQVASGGLGILLLGENGLVTRLIIQNDWTFRTEAVAGLDQATDIACDSSEVCVARRNDGTIWTWNGGRPATLLTGVRLP